MSKSDFDKRFELLFFNPEEGRDAYLEKFHLNFPEYECDVYSPLYDLRDQIRDLAFQKKWFPVVLLLNILIEGIAKNILSSDTDNMNKGLGLFYNDYLELNSIEKILLREFRNAREHNFSLFIGRLNQDKRSGKKKFNELSGIIPRPEKLKINKDTYFKIIFSASEGGKQLVSYSFDQYNDESNYCLIAAHINPKLFYIKVEGAIEKLRENIKSNSDYQERIMKNLKVDNWIHIIYRASQVKTL